MKQELLKAGRAHKGALRVHVIELKQIPGIEAAALN